MDESKIFPFEGVVSECVLPHTIQRGDECIYLYFFKKTSNDQFDQIKVSFEIDAVAPSQAVKPYRLLYEKDYSIIDKELSKGDLYPLLYDCIVDAFGNFRLKLEELIVQYPYLKTDQMKLRDYEEEYQHFEFEKF